MRFAAGILESYLNKDRSDCQGSQLRCECGALARYCGMREKSFVTVVGRLRLRRAYYHCRVCDSGWFPKDKALGMTQRSVSVGMVRLIGLAAAHVSFAELSGLLRDLADVSVSARQVERTAEALGAGIAADERERIDLEPNAARTMYLGMDGTGVPMRKSETEGAPANSPTVVPGPVR